MKRYDVKKIVAVILIFTVLIATPVYSQIFIIGDDLTQDQLNYINNLIKIIKYYHINGYSNYDDIIDLMFDGLFKNLDKYSEYMKPQQAQDFSQTVSGKYSGIGVQIEKQEKYITITGVFDKTPAKEAGLKVGDKIISVNSESVVDKDVNYVASKIRGAENSTVNITILRDGSTYDFTLIRKKITVPVVEYKILNGNIGYLKLTQFTEDSSKQVKEALDVFDAKKVKKIILDIRNNPGGLLDEVAKIAEYFVPEGPIVTIEYKGEAPQVYSSKNKQPKYKLVVLTNESSASATEILAQAIKDTKVGIILGTKTYGKGTVQVTIPLSKANYMAKLTVAKYKSPSGYYVDGKGVIPNKEVLDDSLKDFGPDKILTLSAKEKFKKGDMNLEVLAAQQRLYYLGYLTNWNAKFDDQMVIAVKKFQKDNKLSSSGELDLNTQKKIIEKFNEFLRQKYVDKQLNEAIKYMQNVK